MKSRKPSAPRRLPESLTRLIPWLTPGVGIKRWFVLILAGITLLGVGLAVLILEIYRTAPETWWLPILSTASLRFLARPLRALIFGGVGLGMIIIGIWELNRSLLKPFIRPGLPIGDALRSHRQREKGPRIVAIGGGHGLATLLRGLKKYSHNITAIVTVADDGGSSGRLRREMGILPPGDIRNCLAALSTDEALLAQLFQYRFPNEEAGLDGHSFGNLFITALAEITGSFEEAVVESGRVLAVHGRVLPSTLNNVRLVADVRFPNAVSDVRIKGESQIPTSNGRVNRVWLEPNSPPAFPEAIQAILAADIIIIGPGSLFTSILPNLLVPDILDAIRASRALKLFVCNLATEPGETDQYSCGDHIHTLEDHVGGFFFDVVIANCCFDGHLHKNSTWVYIESDLLENYPIYEAELVDSLYPWRHDSDRLAQAILDIFQERTGPLIE